MVVIAKLIAAISRYQERTSMAVDQKRKAAAKAASALGYEPYLLSSTVDGEAREVGRFLAALAREIRRGTSTLKPPCALIAGGETVVRIKGTGKGGRNQELALSAALGIAGLPDVVIFSVGSDGTDGPTDAAGGMVDGSSVQRMRHAGKLPEVHLDENDSYHALKSIGDLLVTGSTGTNVNDLMVVLVREE
jgi:hydroxypyruvate reductase